MPVVELELVTNEDESDEGVDSVVQPLVDALGKVFESGEAGTWLRLRTLPRSQYAENGGRLPDEVEPVFVSITHKQSPTGEQREKEAEAVAEAVADILDRSMDFVHVIYEPDAAGRVAFGGRRWA